jgi:hypothetical protein
VSFLLPGDTAVDILELLDQLNRELDSKRHEPFVAQDYSLRLHLVKPVTDLFELFLLDEPADMAEESRFGDAELLTQSEELDWFTSALEGLKDSVTIRYASADDATNLALRSVPVEVDAGAAA